MADLSGIHGMLSGDSIVLNKIEDDDDIFDQVDAFVNLSRDNKTVKELLLYPFTYPAHALYACRYDVWQQIAEGIGNLQAIGRIVIMDSGAVDDFEEALIPDWLILALILRRLRRGIHLYMQDDGLSSWDPAVLPVFARAIHGQAMITGFSTGAQFPFHCLDLLCSTLLTLPALENVSFNDITDQRAEDGQSHESMVKLLQSPVLRIVEFEDVSFSDSLSRAIAKALKERSEITHLDLSNCSFPGGGGAVIASALKTNTTLKHFHLDVTVDEVFYDVLAAALLSNSTLQKLTIFIAPGDSSSCSWLSPLFLALQVNTGLKELTIFRVNINDEELSTAMRLGLGRNSTLESLNLLNITSTDNDTSLWRDAFSFLRTNTALKKLAMHLKHDVTESHATAFRMEFPVMLCENESLETISMISENVRFEDYLVFVAAIQPNTTLRELQFQDIYCDMEVEDRTKRLLSVVKKNYGLEVIPALSHGSSGVDSRRSYCGLGDIHSILQLNGAGRRYLVQDGSSISKGVDVLSAVSNDTNSVFLHLLENPRLCDRSAVETASVDNIENAMSTSPRNHSGNGDGKREQQAPARRGNKGSRRRLE
jgi:hypothetical protein